MATIEKVDFGSQLLSPTEQTNISLNIGIGEKNERNDILLVQTLFSIIGFNNHKAKLNFGLEKQDLPGLTGTFDEKMAKAIWGFQRKMRHHLRNIDGKIHPASYKNRVLRKGPAAPQMMITLLNLLAIDEALMEHNTDVISAVKKISPSIIFI